MIFARTVHGGVRLGPRIALQSCDSPSLCAARRRRSRTTEACHRTETSQTPPSITRLSYLTAAIAFHHLYSNGNSRRTDIPRCVRTNESWMCDKTFFNLLHNWKTKRVTRVQFGVRFATTTLAAISHFCRFGKLFVFLAPTVFVFLA